MRKLRIISQSFAAILVAAPIFFSCSKDNGDNNDKGKDNPPTPPVDTTEVVKGLASITDPLTQDNIYDIGHQCKGGGYTMQQFDIDKDGNIYYVSVGSSYKKYETSIYKVKPGVGLKDYSTDDKMFINYEGHPTGFSVEDGSDGNVYLWIGNWGRKQSNNTYSNMQLVTRCRYEAGLTLKPDASDKFEYFYIGYNRGEVNVAVDPDSDMITFSMAAPSGERLWRRFKTYRLSDVLALTPTDITLTRSGKWGGDTAPEDEYDMPLDVKARDLRSLTPLYEFGTDNNSDGSKAETDINFYDWQGFDIYGGKLYFVEGEAARSTGYTSHNKRVPGSHAAVTVFNLDGSISVARQEVQFVNNAAELNEFNITTTGYIESEGVKVWDGKLCLGFSSSGFGGDTRNRNNVLRFALP